MSAEDMNIAENPFEEMVNVIVLKMPVMRSLSEMMERTLKHDETVDNRIAHLENSMPRRALKVLDDALDRLGQTLKEETQIQSCRLDKVEDRMQALETKFKLLDNYCAEKIGKAIALSDRVRLVEERQKIPSDKIVYLGEPEIGNYYLNTDTGVVYIIVKGRDGNPAARACDLDGLYYHWRKVLKAEFRLLGNTFK